VPPRPEKVVAFLLLPSDEASYTSNTSAFCTFTSDCTTVRRHSLDSAQAIEFGGDLRQDLVGHRAGGVHEDREVLGAGDAEGRQVVAAPEVLAVERVPAVVAPAQAGDEAREQLLPRDLRGLRRLDLLLEAAGDTPGQRAGEGGREHLAKAPPLVGRRHVGLVEPGQRLAGLEVLVEAGDPVGGFAPRALDVPGRPSPPLAGAPCLLPRR